MAGKSINQCIRILFGGIIMYMLNTSVLLNLNFLFAAQSVSKQYPPL
jgi:hypothetical protein